jgi:hypothetical protein
MKTKIFTLTHIDKFYIFILKKNFQPFADKKMSRAKILIIHNRKKSNFIQP